jgi:hypothetical protein
MTLSAGAYPRALRVARMSEKAAIGADKDSIEVVNVGHKNVLHVAE